MHSYSRLGAKGPFSTVSVRGVRARLGELSGWLADPLGSERDNVAGCRPDLARPSRHPREVRSKTSEEEHGGRTHDGLSLAGCASSSSRLARPAASPHQRRGHLPRPRLDRPPRRCLLAEQNVSGPSPAEHERPVDRQGAHRPRPRHRGGDVDSRSRLTLTRGRRSWPQTPLDEA